MAKRTLSLAKIRLDGNTQPRVELDELLVTEYQEAYASDVTMPPLQVMFDGASYWLWDGFHRRWAADRAGLEKLPCVITNGTQQDAQWASYGANSTHGLRRSNADKAKAVKASLHHPMGAKLSDRQIAEHCGVSNTFVGKLRLELERLSTVDSQPIRTSRDGRTINTANIGKSSADDDEEESSGCARVEDIEPEPEECDTRTIADDLRDAIGRVRLSWPDTKDCVVAAVLENIAKQIRNG